MRSRRGAGPRRGTSAALLGAVAGTGLLAVADAGGVEGAADDLVADAGEVLHPAAADQDHRVLLEVVPLARDVGGDLHAARQTDASHLAEGGVRLLRGVRVHPRAHPPPLRGALERGGLALVGLVLAAFADELLDGGHGAPGWRDRATGHGRGGPCQGQPGAAGYRSHVKLTEVHVPVIGLERFLPLLGEQAGGELTDRAAAARKVLAGRTVWNVNTTAAGGGVAEMLQTLLGYSRGAGGQLGEVERAHFEEVAAANGQELAALVRPGDIVLVHDPQPAGLVAAA